MPRVIALIPARSGSKGIPNKNFRPLADGLSCVQRAIWVAHDAKCDQVVVSSDGCDSLQTSWTLLERPAELAQDDTPMLAVVQHALEAVPGDPDDIWLLLQPTQPLRQPKHLRAALDLLQSHDAESVVSVTAIPPARGPEWLCWLGGLSGYLCPFDVKRGLYSGEPRDWSQVVSRRQDIKDGWYRRDGTVYAFRRSTVEKYGHIYGVYCLPLIIPADESCELDTMEQWRALESRLHGASPTPD